jgi:hypothetical protein
VLRAATAINMDKSGTNEGKAAEDAVFCKAEKGLPRGQVRTRGGPAASPRVAPSQSTAKTDFSTNGQRPVSGLAKANGNRGVRRLETRAARGPFRQE